MKTSLLILMTIFFLTPSFAQDVIDYAESSDNSPLVHKLEQAQLKITVAEYDLESLTIVNSNGSRENLPNILMPTVHALEYAIIDFSQCDNGLYILNGLKGDERISVTIQLENK